MLNVNLIILYEYLNISKYEISNKKDTVARASYFKF